MEMDVYKRFRIYSFINSFRCDALSSQFNVQFQIDSENFTAALKTESQSENNQFYGLYAKFAVIKVAFD